MARRLQREESVPTDTAWPSNPGQQAEQVVQFYREELVHHFEAEEKILFPALRPHLKHTEKIVDELLRQHRAVQRTIAWLEAGESKGLKDRLRELGELLAEHIRLEEDKLFPLCEKRIPSEILARVGNEIEEAHHATRCKTPRKSQH